MRNILILPLLLVFLACAPGVDRARAQSVTLEEREFWRRLYQTDTLLQNALDTPPEPRRAALAQLQALWRDVDAVRLVQGDVIAVDVDWLLLPLDSADADVQRLKWRVRAVLDYQVRRGDGLNLAAEYLAQLDRVLRDNDFSTQPDERPVEESSGGRSGLDLSPGALLSRIALGALVVVMLGLVARYVLRTAQVQRAALAPAPVDDAPISAEAAGAIATQAMTAQDYRAAIRYLYLSSLLALDTRGVIRYDPSLTNQEHLKQVGQQPNLYAALQPVVEIFDRVWYGTLPADDALYRQFRQHVEHLERQP